MPVADLDVLRVRVSGPGLQQRLQAHQEHGPLCAAMVHELDWLLSADMAEHDNGVLMVLRNLPVHRRADPLGWSVDNLP